MEQPSDWVEVFGVALAAARRTGTVADLRLDQVMTLDRAEAVQSVAVEAYGSSPAGYSMQGTTTLSRRQICCDGPIYGPLLDSDVVRSGARFRLPRGVLGAGCSFAFAIGRPFPAPDEEITLSSVSDAVADCRLAIEILGRRVSGSVPLNAFTATADFALGVLHVEGKRTQNLADLDLAQAQVAAKINGKTVTTGRGADVLSHPLEAVVWLARELKKRGRDLEAGDLITTGTCVGILQVMPGQVFEADYGSLGSVSVVFE